MRTPQRLNLGRIGMRLQRDAHSQPSVDPADLQHPTQHLDLWTGLITSSFGFADEDVRVETAAAPDASAVAFRIESRLIADGRALIELEFPYASSGFFQGSDWTATERHTSTLQRDASGATITRRLDGTAYSVHVALSGGAEIHQGERPHLFVVSAPTGAGVTVLDLVVSFTSADHPKAGDGPVNVADIVQRSAQAWESFWTSGAALDLSGTSDPRAAEIERRTVLSQYLTRVNSAGSMPPQETGLITNSWQGKFHLEMHLWHHAHFATWGRPELLEKSLHWYRSILDIARTTAERQGYPGARWPKQVGPDGRESPTPIGALLAWQQPHILYLLELVWRASDAGHRARLLDDFSEIATETATFMAAFADARDDDFHLGPPIMPAQEFYDATITQDPTFELAYWWWGLEIAQRWQERLGKPRDAEWTRVQEGLATPLVIDGVYRAVRDPGPLRRDDHPSAAAAFGLVPATPLIAPITMAATLTDIMEDWDWPSTWGWDHPMLAMTAARLGNSDLAIDTLLGGRPRNNHNAVGHNPQMGAALPLYLPGNGSFLAAVSLIVAGGDDGTAPSMPANWSFQAEGFVPWP